MSQFGRSRCRLCRSICSMARISTRQTIPVRPLASGDGANARSSRHVQRLATATSLQSTKVMLEGRRRSSGYPDGMAVAKDLISCKQTIKFRCTLSKDATVPSPFAEFQSCTALLRGQVRVLSSRSWLRLEGHPTPLLLAAGSFRGGKNPRIYVTSACLQAALHGLSSVSSPVFNKCGP